MLFGTLETWLIWNLTGGPKGGVHVTDVTNASRTLLMDLHTLQWSSKLLGHFDIPEAMMPRIVSNGEVYGRCVTVIPGVPIAAALGDQQAALFGQLCFEPSDAKCTYGTGAFLLMNVGTSIVRSEHGLLSTVAYAAPGMDTMYALEGPDRGGAGRWSSGSATRSVSSTRRRRSRRWPGPSTTTAGATSCRRSPGSSLRTGIPRRAASWSG